jgi:pimeloyl-ACP methyl ester carboxylesterase
VLRPGLRFAILSLLALPSAAPATDIAARLPDGRTIQFRCVGTGKPTILLEPGWSADKTAWPRVQPALATRSRTCSYDRAGAGESDPGPLPRDGAAIAADLDAALRAARIPGPFLLVGHSAGGLYVRHFALRRPGEIAGIVLADSTVEHLQARFEARFGPGAGSLDALIKRSELCLAAARAGPIPADDPKLARCRVQPETAAATRWEQRLSELTTLFGTTSSALAGERGNLGAIPLVVLTAGRDFQEPVASVWQGLHREVAARSTCSTTRVIAESGHMMMRDRPDAIIGAVDDVLASARSGRCGLG